MQSPTTDHPTQRSFDDLFRWHYPAILSFFRQRGFSSEDSLDLAQDTFLQVYRGIDRFRGDSGVVSRWIFQIASNRYKEILRSQAAQKRPRVVLGIDGVEEAPLHGPLWLDRERRDPLEELLLVEVQDRVREGLDDLPPQMRRVAVLRYGLGYKYREIGLMMGISIETVKAHLFQVKLHLRKKLGKPQR